MFAGGNIRQECLRLENYLERALTLGSAAFPRLNGDATTVGTRKPSSALPSTRSGSTLLAAVARGGATCSKKPPHSSKFTMKTVLAHFGPLATAWRVL